LNYNEISNPSRKGDGMDASHPLIDAAIDREGREDS